MAVQDFQWSTRSVSIFNTTYNIPTINSSWGTLLKNYGISESGVYEWDIIFNNNGRQKFECSCDDDGYMYIDGEYIGTFSDIIGSKILTTTTYYSSGTTHRITLKRSNTQTGLTAIAVRWSGYDYNAVKINLFRATPNPVADGTPSGTPNSSTTLQWDVSNASKIFIDNNIGEVSNTGGSNNLFIDTKLKSIANSVSPATKTYKLTAVGNVLTDIQEQTVTISVYNDNTPSNFTIPPFYNLNPAEQIIYNLGGITGIDMPTLVIGSPGVTVDVNNSGGFSGSKLINNNDILRIKFAALEFNQSPKSLTNSQELWVQIGTLRRYFNATTRAPNPNEVFDYSDISEAIPYPRPAGNSPNDGPSTPYLVSPTTVSVNELELANPDRINETSGFEIKTTYNDIAEVRYRPQGQSWSQWQNSNNIYVPSTNPAPRLLEKLDMNPIQARTEDIANSTPKLIQTRSSGILTAKNITES